MKFETAFNCGDKAWVYTDYAQEVTVGQIRVEYTKSNGLEGTIDGMPASFFSNYAPHPEDYHEVYMCEETGVGSGTVWELGKNIFRTKEECVAANAERIEEQRKAKEERHKWEREDAQRRLTAARLELERLEELSNS